MLLPSSVEIFDRVVLRFKNCSWKRALQKQERYPRIDAAAVLPLPEGAELGEGFLPDSNLDTSLISDSDCSLFRRIIKIFCDLLLLVR